MAVLAPRLFGYAAANAMVPRLQEIFGGIREELEAARRVAAELGDLGHPLSPGTAVAVDPEAEPAVQERQARLLAIGERIGRSVREVAEMGAEVKSPEGLV